MSASTHMMMSMQHPTFVHSHPSHPPPPLHHQSHHHTPSMAASLLLPTPPPPSHSHSHSRSTSCPQLRMSMPESHIKPARPKLSLNTSVPSQLHTCAGKASSLRLETLSAVSPTVRNTFSNAYEPPASPSLSPPGPASRLSKSPLSLDYLSDVKEPTEQHSSRTPSTSSVSSASTYSEPALVPYKVSHSLRSILSNSPLPTSRLRRMSIAHPFFPAPKRVSFRTPLDEEIKTTRFTLAHSDIDIQAFESDSSSSLTSESSTDSMDFSTAAAEPLPTLDRLSPNVPPPQLEMLQMPTPQTMQAMTSPSSPSRRRSRRHMCSHRHSATLLISPSTPTRSKRDSSSEEEDEDSDNARPETPVAGRRKRQREWTWTLGSLPGYTANADTDEERSSLGSRGTDISSSSSAADANSCITIPDGATVDVSRLPLSPAS